MTERTGRPWLNYLLGVFCAGAIVAAILVVGPEAGGQSAATRTAKAVEGVVQSTVSGSGNLAPSTQLNLGFKTSGTVTHIFVAQGEHVTEGQLLAELDPSSTEVTLEQARASLQAAEAKLAKEDETGGEGSGGSGASPATAAAASALPANAAPTTTETSPKSATTTSTGASPKTSRAPAPTESSSAESESSGSAAKATISAATREANLASARATVKSDALAVRSDEEALADTKLYAPESGTIVTLSGQVGEVVSASGTTRASSSASSESGGSGASGSSARSGGGSSGSGSGSGGSGSTGSSGSAFAVLADLSSMQLVAALSESEISSVKAGQIATVTVEALEGRKLAAHVSEVATLSTSSSGVVSYDVTFQLDQMDPGVKPGMSATAEVVVKQAEGVNVPTSAITAGSVTVSSGGRQTRRRVVTGLAGNSSTIILSGLKAGETVVLPSAVSTRSSTSLTSKLGSRLGGGGGAGGFGGGGGGGAVFFRGGG